MTETRFSALVEAAQVPHNPVGWLSVGIVLALVGLLHAVFPGFMWRFRVSGRRLRHPDRPTPSPAAFTADRYVGVALAAVGVVVIVLVSAGTLR